MRVRRVPALLGWRWVAGGFRLLAKRPLALLALLVFDLFLLVMPSTLPVVGALMPTLLTPVFAVGLMVAMRAADSGGTPGPQMLFAAFGDSGGRAWKRLLALGAFNAMATFAAVALSSVADDGMLLRVVTGQEVVAPAAGGTDVDAGGTNGETGSSGDGAGRSGDGAGGITAAGDGGDTIGFEAPGLTAALTIFLLLLVPIQAASWYAPLFIAWHGVGVGKALFFSLVAVWRNKGAFAVYVVSWIAVAMSVSAGVALLRGLLGGATPLASMLFFLVSLGMLTAMYGSIWLSYRDAIEPAPDAPPGPDAIAA